MNMARFLLMVTVVSCAIPAWAVERHMRQPRVPADKLAEARTLTNPLPGSPEILEKGKVLYNGKGTCFNCHGTDGGGNGPGAAQQHPSPRNFRHHGFWRHRTEGEIFWVIKNGVPGTSMIGFGNVLSDEEIWSLVRYVHSFASERGRGMMGHRRRMGPMMESGSGMGGMGRGGPGGEMGGCEGDACGR
jgi:mono/diheme cytochrome c family protein